jgi:predicted nuclease of predicted toxin-antitoxin system
VRLLFDEQLAEQLCELLRNVFPESQHIRLLGAGGASDNRIWQLAIEHDSVLVTKDEDFHRFSVMRGAPPKVIWIRIGNCTTAQIAALLLEHRAEIEWFGDQEEATVLELGHTL